MYIICSCIMYTPIIQEDNVYLIQGILDIIKYPCKYYPKIQACNPVRKGNSASCDS